MMVTLQTEKEWREQEGMWLCLIVWMHVYVCKFNSPIQDDVH